jgi:isopenicillin N synthase-like dioxygenase
MRVLTVDYHNKDASEVFTQSLINTGFAVVKNHPLDFNLVRDVYKEWQKFFASSEKNKYLYDPEKQDGYFPTSTSEVAKGYTIKDLKEFYHIYPWGRYPTEISQKTRELYHELSQMAAILLQWVDENTPREVREKFSMPLSDMITDSSRTLLRIIHYPPLRGDEESGAVRAAAHEDINLITLLPASTAPGLQVKDVNNNWHDVPCDPESIVVNAGDMLQMCSDYYYRSTTHRVMNPIGEAMKESRLSMPLFLHPRDEVRLSPVHTAKSYLFERLKELGLKKDL